MKTLATLFFILLSTLLYSQEMPFHLMESMCKVEVWNNDSSRFESNELYKGCYGFYHGSQNDTMIVAIGSFKDSTDWTYYKVLSHQNMVKWELHWLYRAIQMDTGKPCTIHHLRQQYLDAYTSYNMIQIEFEGSTIRFIDEVRGQ